MCVCCLFAPRFATWRGGPRARVCVCVARKQKIVFPPASASPGRPWRALATFKIHTNHNWIDLGSSCMRKMPKFRSFKSAFCGLELPMVSLWDAGGLLCRVDVSQWRASPFAIVSLASQRSVDAIIAALDLGATIDKAISAHHASPSS